MKARILDPQVKVYSSMDDNGLSIATLREGSEIEFGGSKRKAGKQWVPIILPSGQKAFIPGGTRISMIREGILMDKSVDLHSEPSAGSLIKKQLQQKSALSILQVVRESNEDWVKVRDATGNEGFIHGNTRVRLNVQKTKSGGRRSIISGVMWLAAGAFMIYSEITSTTGTGFGLLGFAALIFGLIQLVSGIVQYVNAPA